MIPTLYEPFRHWSEGGSVYILSDLHFNDGDCKLMDPNWITPKEQVAIINNMVKRNDTFICLGDVGKADYVREIKAGKKILILGNHDAQGAYKQYFDEVYAGPVFIADKILLSHEPVYGLPWCLNIHGHDHNNVGEYREDCKHINLAANVCGYTPINLGKIIKEGILADIPSIHRMTIDGAVARKKAAKEEAAKRKRNTASRRFTAPFYTKGKYDRSSSLMQNVANEYLYSCGKYSTRITREDLPEHYVEVVNLAQGIRYSYVKTAGIKDILYTPSKVNHMFRDDYVYISYHEPLRIERVYDIEHVANADVCVRGGSIIPVLLGAEKYSGYDISKIKEQVEAKRLWLKEFYHDDYVREVGADDVDLFEHWKERMKGWTTT